MRSNAKLLEACELLLTEARGLGHDVSPFLPGGHPFAQRTACRDAGQAVAWRDAEDRADRLEHSADAEAGIRRALEADDPMMVKAIARKAHARGWAEVATMGIDVELLQEVSHFEQLNSPKGRRGDERRLFRWSV
jgi:hypothetical protein